MPAGRTLLLKWIHAHNTGAVSGIAYFYIGAAVLAQVFDEVTVAGQRTVALERGVVVEEGQTIGASSTAPLAMRAYGFGALLYGTAT